MNWFSHLKCCYLYNLLSLFWPFAMKEIKPAFTYSFSLCPSSKPCVCIVQKLQKFTSANRDGHWEGMGKVCLYLYFTSKYCYPMHCLWYPYGITNIGITHMSSTHIDYTHTYPWIYYFLPSTHLVERLKESQI